MAHLVKVVFGDLEMMVAPSGDGQEFAFTASRLPEFGVSKPTKFIWSGADEAEVASHPYMITRCDVDCRQGENVLLRLTFTYTGTEVYLKA
jgi:hypothetical protein